MIEEIKNIKARLEAAGCGEHSSMTNLMHWMMNPLAELSIHQLLDAEGKPLATFITRAPSGKAVRKFRTLCFSDPQLDGEALISGLHSLGRHRLVVPGSIKPTQQAKVMEAEHGVQYAEFYDGFMKIGCDQQSYFIVAGKILTAPDHFLHKVNENLTPYPAISEVCERQDWTVKTIWSRY